MRLIDADELFTTPMQCARHNGKPLTSLWAYVVDQITHAPTIDAVPVVRCKDCRYYRKNELGVMLCYNDFWNDAYAVHTNADDFCSFGEWKDGEA